MRDAIAARLDRMERAIAARPIMSAPEGSSVYVASILGFNTLSSGQPGIKKTSTTLSAVVDFDEMTVSSTVDYVGVGYLWIDSVQQFVTVAGVPTPKRVKIALDARSALPQCLEYGVWVRLGLQQISIGTNVKAYRPDYFV